MEKYRNINTGAVIGAHNPIHGKDWQEEKSPAASPVKRTAKKPTKAEAVKK